MLASFWRAPAAERPVPLPLADRGGHVGGVEMLVLDGTRYFFGFDFSSDLVISPLIDDIDLMSRFAADNMRQRDGRHGADYWRQLAEHSIDQSDLTASMEARTFNTATLGAMMKKLASARHANIAAPDFDLPHHLRYLLGAAGGWQAKYEDEFEDEDLYIGYVQGSEPLTNDLTISKAAEWLQDHCNRLVSNAPENWGTLFAVLKS